MFIVKYFISKKYIQIFINFKYNIKINKNKIKKEILKSEFYINDIIFNNLIQKRKNIFFINWINNNNICNILLLNKYYKKNLFNKFFLFSNIFEFFYEIGLIKYKYK